jgi:hypothetical protein
MLSGQMANFTSTTNTNFHAYYVPEFEMVVRKYRSLQHDSAALDAFTKSQRNIASQIMEVRHAHFFLQWLCQTGNFAAREKFVRMGGDIEEG